MRNCRPCTKPRTPTVTALAVLAAVFSGTWAVAREYSKDQSAILGHIAAVAIARDRCPTIKVNETAVALLLSSARLGSGDLVTQPTSAMAKLWTKVANDKGEAFCHEIWAAYGPDGSVAPMLLLGRP